VARVSATEPTWSGVTFDLWYTLVYQTPAGRARYERRRRAVWEAPLTRAGLLPAGATAAVVALEQAAKRAELTGEAWTIAHQARWLTRLTGVRIDPEPIAVGIRRALRSASIAVAPGAPPMLDRLARAGIPCAVVSNVLLEPPVAMHDLLHRLALDRWFTALLFSSEIGHAKPSPAPFTAALSALGTPPAKTLHVGDLSTDVLGARRAGLRAALFRGLERWAPTPSVHLPAVPRGTKVYRRWSSFP
jgi:FMN phosphatase YigB (HAD superfamily)